MTVNFYKYHGAGNDFVVIDNRLNIFFPAPEVVNRLCHRRFGIGADGML
ncbi:MAG TPA: diaminopimelate epimerase, partial [Bacteroidales bacterium]|nr:diaminopimelate epimerase [Bacteroidales bacterium]